MGHLKPKRNSYIYKKVLGGLEGNALGSAIFEPMWAVFSGLIFFYLPLYMKALGVSEVQMGFINSLNAVLMAVTSIIAGPITDKLGRKRTTLYFDLISWTVGMAVWAMSQNFIWFVIAGIINSFNKVSFTSWTCLSVEDTPLDKRAVLFGLIMIINLGSGIFTPVTGLFIDRVGVVPTMRTLYVLGCISMTLMFFGRNRLVEETTIGKELIMQHNSISTENRWKDYVNAIKYMFTKKLTLFVFIIMLLTNFQTVFQFFMVIYLNNSIGIDQGLTSIIPGISAGVYLIIYFILLPRLMRKSESANLIRGLIFCSLGAGTFLLVSRGNYLMLIISTVLTASGNIIMTTFRDTLWSNVIGHGERAKIFSACQGIISIVSIPSGIIAGYMFKINGKYPFIVVFIIFILSTIFAVIANKEKMQAATAR